MHTVYAQHRVAVQASIDVVATVRRADLGLATPCDGWTLADLLSHMTAQHHGFAAAARGRGADPDVWRPEPFAAAISADPSGTYAAAARDVLTAFTADGVDDAPFALPEFGQDVTVAGETAMGFHFVDVVVHGWDVAATLATPFTLPADVIAAVLPLVFAVPDGDFRDAANSPFARALTQTDDTWASEATGNKDDFARILRHLGRRPDWARAHPSAIDAAGCRGRPR